MVTVWRLLPGWDSTMLPRSLRDSNSIRIGPVNKPSQRGCFICRSSRDTARLNGGGPSQQRWRFHHVIQCITRMQQPPTTTANRINRTNCRCIIFFGMTISNPTCRQGRRSGSRGVFHLSVVRHSAANNPHHVVVSCLDKLTPSRGTSLRRLLM